MKRNSSGTAYHPLGGRFSGIKMSALFVSIRTYHHQIRYIHFIIRASFHPLTNRKHHCRLCGRIICSLPVKDPQRLVTCSILFVVDTKTKKIEEVGESVDYGVRKRPNANANKADEADGDEKFLKGVRICRECRPILLFAFCKFD